MIRAAFIKVGKLFEDRNQKVIERFSSHLADLIVDERRAVTSTNAAIREVKSSDSNSIKAIIKDYERTKARLDILQKLQKDLESIRTQVFLGA